MKTTRRKKLDAKKAGRPPSKYYVNTSLSYRDMKTLVTQVGTPNKWRIEYGDYIQLKEWINKHDPNWPRPTEGHTLFGIPMYKREYVEPDRLRLVNEFTEAAIMIDFNPMKGGGR